MEYIANNLAEKLSVTDIYSFFPQSLDKDFVFKGETHEFPELVYVHSGKVGITAGENAYELKAGMGVIHKAGEFHAIRAIKNTNPVITVIAFGCDINLSSTVFNITPQQKAVFKLLQESLNNSFSHTKTGTFIKITLNCSDEEKQVIKNLLETFLLYVNTSEKITLPQTQKDKLFSKAVSYLQENINESISAENVSRHLNICNTSLKVLFRKYTGMGVMRYFLLMKLKKSQQMLLEGKSIREISDSLGFSSQNYFSYAFKKEYGISPIKFKQ